MATTIKMPQLGESVTEGTIERWLVKVGDTVAQYDPLFEVVTDKVNAEVPAEVGGTVTSILVADGQTVKVGTPLAEISEDGESYAQVGTRKSRFTASAPWIEHLGGKHARWVRVRGRAGSYVALGEIEVYEKR